MLPDGKIVDISLELDPKNFGMRTPAGFTRDLQFAMEVLKEHDAPGGAGQIVRGVHMRLHAGSHVDAPEHNVRGGTQIHQLPLRAHSWATRSSPICATRCPANPSPQHDLEKAIGGKREARRSRAVAHRSQQFLRRRHRHMDESFALSDDRRDRLADRARASSSSATIFITATTNRNRRASFTIQGR